MESQFQCIARYRSSRSQIFFTLDVLKYFANSTGKHLSLFVKVAGLRPATLFKKDSNTGVFLQNLQKF